MTESVRGSDWTRLFWFCAFSEHAKAGFVENEPLKELLENVGQFLSDDKQVQNLLENLKRETNQDKKSEIFWK